MVLWESYLLSGGSVQRTGRVLPAAAFRLAGQPFAILPPPCGSVEEWLSRFGQPRR